LDASDFIPFQFLEIQDWMEGIQEIAIEFLDLEIKDKNIILLFYEIGSLCNQIVPHVTQMGKILQSIEKVKFGKMNVEKGQIPMKKYGIKAIPSFLLFKKNKWTLYDGKLLIHDIIKFSQEYYKEE
jgi:hypothetical protein